MAIRPPRDLRRSALAAGAMLALACGHTDPFSTPPFTTDEPFDPTPPVRLTFNEGADREPSWLPDGSGFLYSSQQLSRGDADVCLAELPPGGGSQRRLTCDLGGPENDTGNGIEWAVVAADGALAFVKASWTVGGTNPSSEALVVAPGLDPSMAADVQHIPYVVPGELETRGVQALRWQQPGELVYVAGLAEFRSACGTCVGDTIVTGRRVATLDVSRPGTAPVAVAGTDFASGVSPGGSSDEIYFTVSGDSRVYRRQLSTGDTRVAHDFGAGGIARDVHVAAGRLTAIVGGRVAFSVDAELGPVQWDSGGIVHVVDLATDADVALEAGARLYRRPALSPSGDRVVAEGYPLLVTGSGTDVPDTTVSRASDLFLFTAP